LEDETHREIVYHERAMKPQDPFIGRDILEGQFQIVQKIGAGGMGTVYKALQPEMNRMVAVKILHPKLVDRKDMASRFRREARALSHLTHPNTVRVLLYGELEDGSLYIVMEYLDGKNLNQLVRQTGGLPLERAVPILAQACGALEEAHAAGIIHRDLKPENVFVCKQGGIDDFVKVLDFGLAKVTQREMRPGSIVLTQEGMVFGTPEFMSPEQAQGKKLTPASDIYSLAVILYEALTGKLPFEARGAMEFLQMQVSAPPIPLNERVPGRTFPPAVWAVMERALAKEPEARYQTAATFGDALVAAATGRPPMPGPVATAVLPSAPAIPVAAPAVASSPRGGGTAPMMAPARGDSPLVVAGVPKRSSPMVLAVLLAFVLGIGVTVVLMRALR
jgi:eukaryotic-like serine/threonine-protein kinase